MLQPTIALSTTEAKYIVVVECAKEVIWLSGLVTELRITQNRVELHCDRQVLYTSQRIRLFILELSIMICGITNFWRSSMRG